MGRYQGRSKEQPKNPPISLHDHRLQHPKECSIPVPLCPLLSFVFSSLATARPPFSPPFLSLFSHSIGTKATRSATTLKVQANDDDQAFLFVFDTLHRSPSFSLSLSLSLGQPRWDYDLRFHHSAFSRDEH